MTPSPSAIPSTVAPVAVSAATANGAPAPFAASTRTRMAAAAESGAATAAVAASCAVYRARYDSPSAVEFTPRTWSDAVSAPRASSASIAASSSRSTASGTLRPSRPRTFSPLYSTGLCEAVTTTPHDAVGSPATTAASPGVGMTPRSIACAPAAFAPAASAALSPAPLGRVSRPIRIVPPGKRAARARPSA